ncbi:MAG: J domain-containing protein [Bacteroidia bacterium]|nr:J domain-containing protein [Bacteroidia bacterium]
MAFIDYYKTLELSKTATDADIKKAYRKFARKYHPDVNPGDDSSKKKFQEVNEANEVLSDPEKRKKYDKYGEEWKHADAYDKQGGKPGGQGGQSYGGQRGGNPFGGGGNSYGGDDDGDFSDFFESMFGGRGGRSGGRGKYKGNDLNATLQLNLEDAMTSKQQTITVNGKSIRLTIPAGIENGQTIKIAGHGGDGANGGPKGDLLITFSIAPNPVFRRDGNDLHKNVDIDLYTAVLGGEITVDTMDSKVKLKIAPGTKNGSKVKLKGKGVPVYKKEGQAGDLYLSYTIAIPTELSEKEKELFTELSNLRK